MRGIIPGWAEEEKEMPPNAFSVQDFDKGKGLMFVYRLTLIFCINWRILAVDRKNCNIPPVRAILITSHDTLINYQKVILELEFVHECED